VKKKTLLITTITLIVILFAYLIFAHDLGFSYSEGSLSGGYAFRFVINWWELILMLILFGFLIFVIVRKSKNV
jgi:hypothetical protein